MPVCTVNSQTVEVREGDRVGKISQTYLITDILGGGEECYRSFGNPSFCHLSKGPSWESFWLQC